MKVLFLLGKYPNYGGVETVTTVIANQFNKRNIISFIASFEQPHPKLNNSLSPDVQKIYLSYPVLKMDNYSRLKKLIKSEKIDFIINQWCVPFHVTLFCQFVIRNTSCQLLAVHHNAPNKNSRIVDGEISLDRVDGNIKKIYYRIKLSLIKTVSRLNLIFVYLSSKRYIILSSSFIPLFSTFTGIKSPSKLKVITNPVTISNRGFKYSPEKKKKWLIYVGRIDFNQKRVIRIIKIWEKLYLEHPDWNLKIVGDGPEKEFLERVARERKIPRISFEGFRDPLSYYKKASILLLTSEYEGFGLVLAEAMTFGTIPVVYGSYSAVFDIINNSEDGYIINPPFSEDKFIATLSHLLKDKIVRERTARNAIRKSALFDLSRIVDEWDTLFVDLNVKYSNDRKRKN